MKTIICDIDGTIFKYPPNGSAQIVQEGEQLLPGVQEQFNHLICLSWVAQILGVY